MGVALVIAVKRLDSAKSRLSAHFDGELRQRVVLAMLIDTIAAARAAPGVDSITVVTADVSAAAAAHAHGAGVVADPTPPEHGDPLNNALLIACRALSPANPNIAVLQGDLPALRSSELDAALDAGARFGRCFVTDRQGTGTSALFAFGVPLHPLFGADSARRHRDSGAVELIGDWPGLRCDIDTPEDLEEARRLGVGPATAAILLTTARPG